MKPGGPAIATLLLALLAGRAQTNTSPAGPRGAEGFTNVAASAGLDFHHVNGASAQRYLPEIMSGGGLFFDYDNDGDLDLAIVNGHVMNDSGHFRPGSKEAQRKLLFRNDGNGRFKEIGRTAGPGFAVEAVGRTLAAGDIDNDGALDLLVTNNGGTVELLRNPSASGNNALLLRLAGTRSNRGAVGARVRLTAGGATQVREVKAGSSYLGQSDLRVHFGLGRATRIDRLEIRWPAGETEVVQNVAINQVLTVTEGRGVTARTPLVRH